MVKLTVKPNIPLYCIKRRWIKKHTHLKIVPEKNCKFIEILLQTIPIYMKKMKEKEKKENSGIKI